MDQRNLSANFPTPESENLHHLPAERSKIGYWYWMMHQGILLCLAGVRQRRSEMPEMRRFEDLVALITGGSSGLGGASVSRILNHDVIVYQANGVLRATRHKPELRVIPTWYHFTLWQGSRLWLAVKRKHELPLTRRRETGGTILQDRFKAGLRTCDRCILTNRTTEPHQHLEEA